MKIYHHGHSFVDQPLDSPIIIECHISDIYRCIITKTKYETHDQYFFAREY